MFHSPAAPPIRRFINLTHDRAEAAGLHQNCFGKAHHYGADESLARAGLQCFAQTLELADDPTMKSRVDKASICAYRLALEPIWYLEDQAEITPELAQRLRPLVVRFLQLCQEHGVTRVSAGTKIETAAARLRQLFELPG